MVKKGLYLICCILIGSRAEAGVQLLDVYHDAFKFDPTYHEQYAQYRATQQDLPASVAALLPSLNFSGNLAREWDHTNNAGHGRYTTHNYGLDINQKLFDWRAFRDVSEARNRVQAAIMTVAYQQQSLMLRAADAYYQVLERNALVVYAYQQKNILKQQLDETKLRYQHKEATVTELDQAKGAYEDVANDLTEAELNAYEAKQNLSTITSKQYAQFALLKQRLPLLLPMPSNLTLWLKKAKQDNLNLRSTQYALIAARQHISALKGDFLPTLSAQGIYDRAKEPTTTTAGLTTQTTRDASLGLNLNWNIFAGGATLAEVKRAQAQMAEAVANMHKAYLTALADARTAYKGIALGRTGILQARSAIHWNSLALKHAHEGYRAGTQTLTDILQIQSKLYAAQRKFSRDRYAYLMSILRLEQAAGTLSVKDFELQNKWLTK